MTTFSLPNASNIQRVVLPNGIVVLAYQNPHVQSAVLYGSLKAGSLYELNGKSGIASLTASALMRGTHSRSFDDIHSTLEDIGADLGMGAGTHTLSFSGKALAEDLPVVLELLADALRYPVFPEEHLQLIKTQRITELKYAQQDTRYRAGRAFREALYPASHPYHHSSYGTMDSIPTVDVGELQVFHQRVYGTHGMVISIVGAIAPEKAIEWVRQYFADWHNPHQPAEILVPPIAPPSEIQRLFTSIDGKTQSDIVMGTLAPSRFAPDYMAVSLANSILGEFGMMGRIGAIIREELGLAYYASSSLEASEAQGAWSVSAGVAPHNIELAIEKAIDELRRIAQEPVSVQDLQDNQSYYVGRLPLRLESSSGIATTLENLERYQLGLDYLANYREMIYSITREDLLNATRKYLNADALVISVAGV
jgi:zinc protease